MHHGSFITQLQRQIKNSAYCAAVLYHIPRVSRERHSHVVLGRHPRHYINLETTATNLLIIKVTGTEQ